MQNTLFLGPCQILVEYFLYRRKPLAVMRKLFRGGKNGLQFYSESRRRIGLQFFAEFNRI